MLFFKECKKIVCSMTFVLYVAAIVAMYISQFVPDLKSPVSAPQPGMSYYGTIEREAPELLMPAAVRSLLAEYMEESYVAYPLMFYKEVKLNEAETEEMAAIIEGYQAGGYEAVFDEGGNTSLVYKESVMPEFELQDVSYARFKELMVQADELIGGGSKYSEKYLISNFSNVPMSYEDAMAEYEELMDEKNITEAYTRLYCDYMGIILAIMPVFVCVSLWQMDKKAQMEQLIYSRRTSSLQLIGTRYLALVCCMAVPVLLTFVHALWGVHTLYPEKEIVFSGAIGLGLYWLIPTIMMVTAFGALLSEILSPFLAIFVQGMWWYMALEMNELTGDISKWTLILRHNTLGEAELFARQFSDLLWNRTAYMILSLMLVGITILFYEKKRKGVVHDVRIQKNHKRKFVASF